MKKNLFSLILLFAFFFQFTSLRLNSKNTQEKTEQVTLQHEVTVTLKLIQVFVTDKKGNPITDLAKSDFVLHDNGKLQDITDFERHVLIPKPEEKVEEKKVNQRKT